MCTPVVQADRSAVRTPFTAISLRTAHQTIKSVQRRHLFGVRVAGGDLYGVAVKAPTEPAGETHPLRCLYGDTLTTAYGSAACSREPTLPRTESSCSGATVRSLPTTSAVASTLTAACGGTSFATAPPQSASKPTAPANSLARPHPHKPTPPSGKSPTAVNSSSYLTLFRRHHNLPP